MNEYPIDSLLRKAVELKASDVHLYVGEVPSFRIHGEIIKSKITPLTANNMISILDKMSPANMKDKTFYGRDVDFSYEIKGIARFRVNAAMSFGKRALTIRVIPSTVPSLEQLNLPEAIRDLAKYENGIILITGTTGSGKSTTIASMLDYINEIKSYHIITIEDPIEFVYTSKKSIFTQRQVGIDTPDFLSGLKYALRQDPNVILIGEIRDMETIKSALNAAETGHLVVSTMHTINAIQTFHRVLSFFSPSERDSVRQQFVEVFRGSISQRLIPTVDNKGRVAALEILQTTPTIKDFLLKDELEEVYKLVKKGSNNSMLTFNMSLYNLYKEGKITKEMALSRSDDTNELMQLMRGVYNGSENSY